MGTDTISNALNQELGRVVKSTRTDTLNLKNKWTAKLLEVLEQHAVEEKKVLLNESLSQQGKQQALATFATNETAPQLKWVRNLVKDREQADQGYRTQFYTIDSGIKDAAVRMPTFTYLWSKLDTLDLTGRITRFTQAAEKNEVVVMTGMLENPLGQMVNEDVKERALTERAKRLFPQHYENFEQNAYLLEFLRTYRNWIGRWLADEVGVEVKVIRENLGDEIADVLTVQRTGVRPETDTQLVGASK
ncbi:hypothetical protein ACYX34_15170 [Nitrospira sp. CMX1]